MVDSEQSVEIYSFKSTGTDLKCWPHAHWRSGGNETRANKSVLTDRQQERY